MFGLAPCYADIVLLLGSAGSGSFDTGVAGPNKTIPFYIRQDVGSSDAIAGAVVDFELSGGVIQSGKVGSEDSVSSPPLFGETNLKLSQFVENAQSVENPNPSFVVNQEFDDPQSVPTSPTLWFELTIDTTGLAGGDYMITLLDPGNSFVSSLNQPVTASGNLTFTVTAVPELSSFALVGFASVSVIAIGRRNSRRRKTSIAKA
ncbi:hypothetical protein Poly51_46320 [Rubripirellula tenax]|uniref:PEP-CTERM protein-sorting domain-containing protein n=2 Tax=Rubripirellula tenax TaxID=2528015 RepID=A0A5C6EJP4_9BACT|nr:hypothetical protein Poly51_46320 [Rubripirellula tenax]